MKNKKNAGLDYDLEKIHEFLELAIALAQNGVGLEKKFDGLRVAYDGYWTRYKVVDDPVRCQLPEDSSEITELPQCARNCWKLLIFSRNPEDVEASVKLLIPLLKSGEIKSLKHNGDVVGKSTLPRNDNKGNTLVSTSEAACVIVIYTWGTGERDRLKARLHSIGFNSIPYRRGCKMFEDQFGHWKQWFKER